MKSIWENISKHILLLLVLVFIIGGICGSIVTKNLFYWQIDNTIKLERGIYKGVIYSVIVNGERTK